MRMNPTLYADSKQVNFYMTDETALQLLSDGILVVVPSGNYGGYGLGSISKTTPWVLTTGSCTSKKDS